MTQRLLLPFKRGMIICGYKTAIYRSPKPVGHGYEHYGIDVSSIQGVNQADHFVRASGDGEVVHCVYDRVSGGAQSLGWALAIRYNGCISRDGSVRDLIVRYMHSPTCYVQKGQTVRAGDKLLDEGMVGTSGYHVHVEMDTDTRQGYANWTPQVSAGHGGWVGPSKGAVDSTVNPSLWLWQSDAAQLEPYYAGWNRAWINAVDTSIPHVPADNNDELRERLTAAEADLAAAKKKIEELEAKLAQAREHGRQLLGL